MHGLIEGGMCRITRLGPCELPEAKRCTGGEDGERERTEPKTMTIAKEGFRFD